MKQHIKKSRGIQIIALTLGLLVSGIVLAQGFNNKGNDLAEKEGSLESIKNTIKSNKNLIVNSYLLGVSIFKETSD
ncbi:hypothetical protein [Ekhidna sp. To15]|uniref:hypothetical protein n=1 Tax=Ekhidna sp. To15 TaxID=3395267 RepID=UPI003F52555C